MSIIVPRDPGIQIYRRTFVADLLKQGIRLILTPEEKKFPDNQLEINIRKQRLVKAEKCHSLKKIDSGQYYRNIEKTKQDLDLENCRKRVNICATLIKIGKSLPADPAECWLTIEFFSLFPICIHWGHNGFVGGMARVFYKKEWMEKQEETVS